jgi:solute:Na+ symporter, SSS family
MQAIDIAIVALYMALTIAIGLYARRRAARSLDDYYLGGKSLPWYFLGISNASGMFDISGTMWLVTLCVVYGLKSIWIPWLWPVFNQVFLLAYLSVWLRRSNVLTGAEWMQTRFGSNLGGQLSQFVIIGYAVLSILGFLAYGFVGIGKFIEVFLPWSVVDPFVPFDVPPEQVANVYGIAFTGVATLYVVLGGMYSLVWTDVAHYILMTTASVIVAAIAIANVDSQVLAAVTPDGWDSPFFGWTLGLDWSGTIASINDKIASDGYSLFGIFMMMLLFKGVLVSAAGPAPNYDMQKILATRSPREGALMSGFVSVVLMPVRYLMIAGFAVLALVYFNELDIATPAGADFERILPSAIVAFAPPGVLGLIVAGLLGAFMSTFAGTLNAAPAYLINDVYRRHINPRASRAALIYGTYAVSVLVVAISTCVGLYIPSINSALQWIVSALWGGYTAANVLKWYWWRLNGLGYFAGMVAGMVGALTLSGLIGSRFPDIPPDILPLYSFPLLLLISAAACVGVTLLTPPDDIEQLAKFYRNVRPWGWWGPVKEHVLRADPSFAVNKSFRRDMFNVVIGTAVQTALVALPMYVVIERFDGIAVCLALTAVGGAILKKSWYDHLPPDESPRPAKNVTAAAAPVAGSAAPAAHP